MITLSRPVCTSRRYRAVTVATNRTLALVPAAHPEKNRVKTPFDRLIQGPKFDVYKNKSVVHTQCTGVIHPHLRGEIAQWTDMGVGKPLSRPIPVVKNGSKTFGVVPSGTSLSWQYTSGSGRLAKAYFSVLFVEKSPVRDDIVDYVSFSTYATVVNGETEVHSTIFVESNKDRRKIPYSGALLEQLLSSAVKGMYETYNDLVQRPDLFYSAAHRIFGLVSLTLRRELREAARMETSMTGNLSEIPEWGEFGDTDSLLDWIDRTSIDLRYTFTKTELSTHAASLIRQVDNFAGNAIAYFKDIKDVGDTIRTLAGLSRGISARSAAQVWLSLRYGDRLTIADTRELLQGMIRSLKRGQEFIARAQYHTMASSLLGGYDLAITRVSTILLLTREPSGLAGIVNSFMKWDVWPTTENVWDLVPFSFVVDWFLDVQAICNQIDAAVRAPYLTPRTQYASTKITMDVPVGVDGFVGTVRFSRYVRKPYAVLDDIEPFTSTFTGPTFGIVQLGDSVALLLANL